MSDTTVHTFTDLGLRTMPIGHAGLTLKRNLETEKKVILNKNGEEVPFIKAMPSNWTQVYGEERTIHKNTPLGGVICGALTNLERGELEVIALDCDNEAAWELFDSINPEYEFKFKSINKAGGTILYLLPKELYDLHQYSIEVDGLKFEYMAKRESGRNAMVYLPTTANETKEPIKKGAILDYPPIQVITLLRVLKPKLVTSTQVNYDDHSPAVNLPFNAPLVKQFVIDCKDVSEASAIYGRLEITPLVEKVYRIFTPKKFRSAESYQNKKYLHPNSDDILTLGSWSEYIVGVSAIAGNDPSINVELYTDFMQAINAQVDDPMPAKRFLTEVIDPMVNKKSKIRGKPIWRYNAKWDQTSHTIINQYGEQLEYFTLENAANRFIEYNHTNKEIVEIQGVRSLRDQIYSKDTDAQQEVPNTNIVKKLKLVRMEDSVKLPLGIFTDNQGHTILNTTEPCFSLRVLRDPNLMPDEIDESNRYAQAFDLFIGHLVNYDEKAIKFMKQVLAYHGKHLSDIPVIMYMVGVGGAGKSHFARFLELLFGTNTTARPSSKQITSQYNDFLMNTAILILTETSDSPKRDQEGIKAILKTVTGEKTIDIETKHRPIVKNVPIFPLPILLANEPWYQEDSNDRRLFSIIPKSTMLESEEITSFEKVHGIRIVSYIEEGIKLGIIAKYLTKFCPDKLPPVPLTTDKLTLSMEQRDPVAVVKSIVATGNWFKLFDLMEEYSIDIFFTAMESDQLRDKDCLFKNQLVELTKALRGDNTFLLTDAAISKEFSVMWLPRQASQYRPRAGSSLGKKLGYVKWKVGIAEPYEDWKLDKLMEEE